MILARFFKLQMRLFVSIGGSVRAWRYIFAAQFLRSQNSNLIEQHHASIDPQLDARGTAGGHVAPDQAAWF